MRKIPRQDSGHAVTFGRGALMDLEHSPTGGPIPGKTKWSASIWERIINGLMILGIIAAACWILILLAGVVVVGFRWLMGWPV